jgi:Sec-independent protein translocase protein TatA
MSALSSVPLFIGPVELMLVGAVVLVIIFGSRATDIARGAGSAAGKVKKTRRAAEQEIEEVKGEFEEGIEPVKEEVEAVEEDIENIEADLPSGTGDDEAGTPGEGDEQSSGGQS